MYQMLFAVILILTVSTSAAFAVDAAPAEPASVKLDTTQDRYSYVLGMQFGQSLKSTNVDLNLALLAQAIGDVLNDRPLAVTPQERRSIMAEFQQMVQAKQQEVAARNVGEGAAFLAANATKKGVVTLPSGLQYKVITEGTGRIPTATDKVKTHYRGTLLNGEQFDSSYDRGDPVEFGVGGVIAGWTEALQLMKEGAKWQLFIPANLAYGERGRPGIPANSTLLFDIELIEIVGE